MAVIQKKFRIDLPLNYLGMDRSVGFDTHRLKATSLSVNVHYKLLDEPRVHMYVSAGGGLYRGIYGRNGDYEAYSFRNEGYHTWTDYIEEAIETSSKQTVLGFHVGTSMEFFLLRKMALWIEGRYRFVDFNNMKGNGYFAYTSMFDFIGTHWRWDLSGDLNFDPEIGTDPGGQADFFVGDTRYPYGEEGLRKARLSMKGFALSIGLKWYF